MNTVIHNLITACEWSPSYFLVFSDNVFSPLLYYSYFGSVIPSLIIALFVYFKGPKKLVNRLLLLTVLSFTIWAILALVTWATEYPSYTMFFWSALNIFEPFVYFFAFYFFYVFIFGKDFSIIQKVVFISPLLLTLALSPTRFGLLGYDISDCERNAVEGIVATYGYVVEIGYMFLILGFSFYFINKTRDFTEKRKVILLTTGIVAFLLSFSSGNILEVFTQDWYIGQYGLFGAPIFVGFLAYIMLKYKTFNTKIFGAQALIVTIGVLIVSMFFVDQIQYLRYVLGGTLLLFMPFGYSLVRSVRREIEAKELEHAQREKIEELAKNLEVANKGQESLMYVMNHQVKGFLGKAKNIFGELLEGDDYGHMPEESKSILKAGLGITNEGVDYVQGILRGAKSGVLVYDMKPFDLKPLVTTLLLQQKDMAEKSLFKLKFDSNIADGDYQTVGDGTQIREAFKNLITNAIKYNQKDGNLSVSMSRSGQKIIFSVKDAGKGMTKETERLLYTPGGMGEDSMKYNSDASGFGLAFVKSVVEKHQGRIWYETEVGRGTTFFVELPVT